MNDSCCIKEEEKECCEISVTACDTGTCESTVTQSLKLVELSPNEQLKVTLTEALRLVESTCNGEGKPQEIAFVLVGTNIVEGNPQYMQVVSNIPQTNCLMLLETILNNENKKAKEN